MSVSAASTSFSTGLHLHRDAPSRSTSGAGVDDRSRKPWLTTFSYRGRWMYVRTRRKWKRRNFKLVNGWVIVVSYRRIADNALDASAEASLAAARGKAEHAPRRSEVDKQWADLEVQEGRENSRFPDRGEDEREARSGKLPDSEKGISGASETSTRG